MASHAFPCFDNETSIILIQLHESKSLIWNTKSLDNGNPSLREDAWRDISTKMKIPVKDILVKLITEFSVS